MDNEKFQTTVLEHMARMTQEITVLRQGMEELRKGQEEIRQDIKEIRQDIVEMRQDIAELQISQVRMENRLMEKINILFDARKIQEDVNKRIFTRLDELEAKIDERTWKHPYIIREDES